ncbi:MAG: hypothetical protein JWN93_3109, partial [Hyphomicrobiales bacterium]|nr:hypothetical protein [Hyphomicrobiales bacterium]
MVAHAAHRRAVVFLIATTRSFRARAVRMAVVRALRALAVVTRALGAGAVGLRLDGGRARGAFGPFRP